MTVLLTLHHFSYYLEIIHYDSKSDFAFISIIYTYVKLNISYYVIREHRVRFKLIQVYITRKKSVWVNKLID